LRFIDRVSEGVGRATAWLIPLLILELVYDTGARYIFNAPTEWSYDISYMLYGAIFMLGAGWTLLEDEHVRIEVLYEKLSRRGRAVVDALGYLIFFFPAVGALTYFGGKFALQSWLIFERAGISMWSPPIYPFKTLIPVAMALLFLQGVAQFIRCLSVIFGRGGR